MREILFKGKRIDNGEWVEGHYYSQGYHEGTIEEEWYHVIKPIGSKLWESIRVRPETLCQYTGLTDKNGRKIWENDILKHYNKVQVDDFESYEVGVVTWNKSICRFVNYNSIRDEQYTVCDWCVYEVIGNVFDNPELLKEGAE